MLEKVKELGEFRIQNSEFTYLVEVDGGVNLENIKQLQDLGVDLAEVNSGLYNKKSFEENLNNFLLKIK